MKKTLKTLALLSAITVTLVSCNGSKQTSSIPGISKGMVDSASYAAGITMGNMIVSANLSDMNMKEFQKGLSDVINEKDLKIDMAMANQILSQYMGAKENAVALENMEKGKAFLASNKENEGVIETESGLQYIVVEEGNGVFPTADDTIEVHYKGTLIDGSQFDSSYDRGEPISLRLGDFIPGWVEGMQKISEGGKIKLFIPSELAYGTQSAGSIKGGSVLIFEVELIKVTPQEN